MQILFLLGRVGNTRHAVHAIYSDSLVLVVQAYEHHQGPIARWQRIGGEENARIPRHGWIFRSQVLIQDAKRIALHPRPRDQRLLSIVNRGQRQCHQQKQRQLPHLYLEQSGNNGGGPQCQVPQQ